MTWNINAMFLKVKMSIHWKLWTIPKVSRCIVDILSQILYDKTQDVGK